MVQFKQKLSIQILIIFIFLVIGGSNLIGSTTCMGL